MASLAPTMPAADGGSLYARVCGLAARVLSPSLLLLTQRLGIASIFWMSARTKVEGWFTISDSTYELFRTEYAGVPLPPEIAAVMATINEHLFSVLLVFGLFTRFSAVVLLGMTAVIEIFVYPDAWSTHLSWTAILLPLIARGGGRWSLDHLLGIEHRTAPSAATLPAI